MDQHHLHLRETDFLDSLGSRASVADFRPSAVRPQSHSQAGAYGRLRKDSDVLSIDSAGLFGRSEFENGVSPFSSIAELAYVANKKFVASSKHFYFIHQSVLNPSLSFFRQRQLREEQILQGSNHRRSRRTQSQRQQSSKQHNYQSLHQQLENHNHLFESRQVRSEPPGHLSTPTGSPAIFGSNGTRSSSSTQSRDEFLGDQQDCQEGGKDEDGETSWHQKNALENLALVEQCISHKISTDYISAIIIGRKKKDKLAKEFFRLSFTG